MGEKVELVYDLIKKQHEAHIDTLNRKMREVYDLSKLAKNELKTNDKVRYSQIYVNDDANYHREVIFTRSGIYLHVVDKTESIPSEKIDIKDGKFSFYEGNYVSSYARLYTSENGTKVFEIHMKEFSDNNKDNYFVSCSYGSKVGQMDTICMTEEFAKVKDDYNAVEERAKKAGLTYDDVRRDFYNHKDLDVTLESYKELTSLNNWNIAIGDYEKAREEYLEVYEKIYAQNAKKFPMKDYEPQELSL